jgi:protein-S-isoprenylcysteine O-methyltransferase Ste14
MKDNVLMIILGVAFCLNIIVINLSPPINQELVAAGYTIFAIGAFLYIISVLSLRRKGITRIVDSGVYGIVRHPMYLGAIIMFFSHIFLGQNWIVTVSTLAAIACCYLIILSDEEQNIQKFGDEYRRYMKKVPRINLISGATRLLQRRKREEKPKR